MKQCIEPLDKIFVKKKILKGLLGIICYTSGFYGYLVWYRRIWSSLRRKKHLSLIQSPKNLMQLLIFLWKKNCH